jgi:hypothetical protein
MTRALKIAFQAARCGGLLSKMTSFLCFQRHQAPIIKISMKKGCPKSSPACKSFWWTLKFSSQTIPNANHLLVAAGQLKKRWAAVSSSLLWHITVVFFIQQFLSSSQNIPRIQLIIEK